MSDIVDEIPETLKPIARTVWENIAHLMGDYSGVPFDQVLVRPRYQGVRGTLRHLAQRLDELTILASDHQDLINVVAELGIEDSSTAPAEAVRELKAEVARLGFVVERMPRWRSIETAPTNETPILLYLPGNREARRVLACSSDGTQWWALSGSVILGTPTHWMPLPPFTSDDSRG